MIFRRAEFCRQGIVKAVHGQIRQIVPDDHLAFDLAVGVGLDHKGSDGADGSLPSAAILRMRMI